MALPVGTTDTSPTLVDSGAGTASAEALDSIRKLDLPAGFLGRRLFGLLGLFIPDELSAAGATAEYEEGNQIELAFRIKS